MTNLEIITCTCCGGIGTLPGPTTGKALKRERKERGVSFNHLLEHFPYSRTYLSDLETDKRPFSNKLVTQYQEAIELAVQTRLAKEDAKDKREKLQLVSEGAIQRV